MLHCFVIDWNRFKQQSKQAKTIIQTATETIGNGDKTYLKRTHKRSVRVFVLLVRLMSGFNTACKAAWLKLTQLEDSEMLSVSQKPRFHANAAIYEKGLYVNNRMQSSLTEFKIDVRLRLHTAINRVDFVSWCM